MERWERTFEVKVRLRAPRPTCRRAMLSVKVAASETEIGDRRILRLNLDTVCNHQLGNDVMK